MFNLRSLRERRLGRLAGIGVSFVVIAIAFVFILPTIADYGGVWRHVRELSALWIVLLGAATVLNVVTFPLPWMVVIPRLGFLGGLRVTQASTALISVVPGGAPMGMAISFGMLRSRNIPTRQAGLGVALTGLWNQLAILLFPLAALALVVAQGGLPGPLEWAAGVGVAVAVAVVVPVAVSLASPRHLRFLGERLAPLAAFAGRLAGRRPAAWSGENLLALRAEAVTLVRERWLALSLTTLANLLTGYLVLELSLRAVGIGLGELSLAESFAAWSLGRLLGSAPITPGGLGVVELGLVGMLVGFAGHDSQVVAGVLIYRFLSLVPTLVLGGIAGLTWKLGS